MRAVKTMVVYNTYITISLVILIHTILLPGKWVFTMWSLNHFIYVIVYMEALSFPSIIYSYKPFLDMHRLE